MKVNKKIIAIIAAIITAAAAIIAAVIGTTASSATTNNNNNNLVVNIGEKSVSVDKSNTVEIQKEIDNLEEEKSKLENENEDINKTNSNLKQQIDNSINADLKNIRLIIDGVDKEINSADSVAVINGEYYYSSNFVEGLINDKELTLNENDNVAYLGDKKYESVDLLDVCPTPVMNDSNRIELLTESISMCNEVYFDGMKASSYNEENAVYAIFNIKGHYEKLNFVVGHIDGTSMASGAIKVYVSDENGKFTKTPKKVVTVNPDESPQKIEGVDVKYAKQIKIAVTTEYIDSCLGIVEMRLE